MTTHLHSAIIQSIMYSVIFITHNFHNQSLIISAVIYSIIFITQQFIYYIASYFFYSIFFCDTTFALANKFFTYLLRMQFLIPTAEQAALYQSPSPAQQSIWLAAFVAILGMHATVMA
ncbi:hypothetical protein ACJX0J_016713, partial [Zea mays]